MQLLVHAMMTSTLAEPLGHLNSSTHLSPAPCSRLSLFTAVLAVRCARCLAWRNDCTPVGKCTETDSAVGCLDSLAPPPPFTPPPFASSPIFLVLVPRELGSFIQSMEGRGTMLVAWDMEQAEHVSRTQMCRMLGRPQLS